MNRPPRKAPHLRSLIICLAAVISTAFSPSWAVNRQFDGCVLAIDPSVGKWLLKEDPRGRAIVPYPPGSAIKPFTVIAALESGASPGDVLNCGPSDPSVPVSQECWYRPGHGSVDMEKAIAVSCDRYFMKLAKSVDWPHFMEVVLRFGVIDRETAAAISDISPDDRLDVMVGLSTRLRVSPSAMLLAYSALFNGGYLFAENGRGGLSISRRVSVGKRASKILAAGMSGATLYGTSWEVGKAFPDRKILSKTGTAPYLIDGVANRFKTHGWYIGLSPAENPRAAIVVFMPEGTGAHEAVPAAIRFWPGVFKSAHI